MHLLIISSSSHHHHHHLPSQPHKHWNHILSDCPSSISRPLSSRNKVNRPFQEIKGCYRTQESPAQIRQTIQTLHCETKLLETLRIWEKEECSYNVPGLLFCNVVGEYFIVGGSQYSSGKYLPATNILIFTQGRHWTSSLSKTNLDDTTISIISVLVKPHI